MLTQPYVEDACSGRFPKPRVFSENFHALLFPKDPLARSLASSLPPALVFVEGIDAYTLEEMTIFFKLPRLYTRTTPNRERQCIGCWLCESPTRRSHSERQCKVVQIRVLVGDAWVRTYSFQADFKAITYQSPCDAVHALVPEEWSACVSTTVIPM